MVSIFTIGTLLATFILVAANKGSLQHAGSGSKPTSVLILDVDNTLYNEEEARVEQQIVQNTHAFVKKHFGMSRERADNLFREHGSTIEGLRENPMWDEKGSQPEVSNEFSTVQEMMCSFYDEVYSNIDLSGLLVCPKTVNSEESTGYTHGKQRSVAELLYKISKYCPIWLASNSSRRHVERVVCTLGLAGVPFAGILTPDSNCHEHAYPTKKLREFWTPLKEAYQCSDVDGDGATKFFLVEDSLHNLEKAREVGMDGFFVDHSDGAKVLELGLEDFLKWERGHDVESSENVYIFSGVEYLKSKNVVDDESMNKDIWNRLKDEIAQLSPSDGALRVVDVGAGLLNMFKKVVGEDGLFGENISKIHYYAYESNKELLAEGKANLQRMGMIADPKDECLFRGVALDGEIELMLHLKPMDFTEDSMDEHVDVLIGCCFADLFDPNILTKALHRFLKTGQVRRGRKPTLLYFPITFAGTTCFYPASPFESPAVPSDTFAFRAYSASLTKRLGHNLNPLKIIDALSGYGGELIEKGPSNWNIEVTKHPYLWDTMLHFFQSSAVPELLGQWNASGWIDRSKSKRADIFVSNVDILLRLDAGRILVQGGDNVKGEKGVRNEVEEIEFVSPRNVRKKKIVLDIEDNDSNLTPDQIEGEFPWVYMKSCNLYIQYKIKADNVLFGY